MSYDADMKKLMIALLLAALLTLPALAASWDGQHGPFTTVTFTFESGANALPGVPGIGPLAHHTTIFINCQDHSISGVRVTIKYADESGAVQTLSSTAGFIRGVAGVSFAINASQIIGSPVFTELRDGASY